MSFCYNTDETQWELNSPCYQLTHGKLVSLLLVSHEVQNQYVTLYEDLL